MSDKILSSPKLSSQLEGRSALYRFYAGFSDHFVTEFINKFQGDEELIVADPWNGTGTTTYTASSMGLRAYGVDINPVMVVIAKAKQVPQDFWSSVSGLTHEILIGARQLREISEMDSLLDWVDSKTATDIRSIYLSIQRLLFPDNWSDEEPLWDDVSSIAAFFLLVLFRVFRNTMGRLSSNPTWSKKPKSPVTVPHSIVERFSILSGEMAEELRVDSSHPVANASIWHGDSKNLPLPDESVGLVVTSPPYCTRIDYAMATLLELTILYPKISNKVRGIREQMIGSPLVPRQELCLTPKVGEKCLVLLDDIRNHTAKASGSYYLKTYQRYFAEMFQSITEIARVLTKGGQGVMVVQNSYYKDIEVDLAGIITQMCVETGMESEVIRSEHVKSTLTQINTAARRYKQDRQYYEQVVRFQKPS